jgi:hypothetical protein
MFRLRPLFGKHDLALKFQTCSCTFASQSIRRRYKLKFTIHESGPDGIILLYSTGSGNFILVIFALT